jgi:hypothetical protein
VAVGGGVGEASQDSSVPLHPRTMIGRINNSDRRFNFLISTKSQ